MVDEFLETFFSKLQINNDTGCWNFNKCVRAGYGRLKINNKRINAHRFTYEVNNGKIQNGLVLDHLCRNTSCVNPDHLEPVTQRENIMRGRSPAIITHHNHICKNGHLIEGDNLYINKTSGQRVCVKCNNDFSTKYYNSRRKFRDAKKWQS